MARPTAAVRPVRACLRGRFPTCSEQRQLLTPAKVDRCTHRDVCHCIGRRRHTANDAGIFFHDFSVLRSDACLAIARHTAAFIRPSRARACTTIAEICESASCRHVMRTRRASCIEVW